MNNLSEQQMKRQYADLLNVHRKDYDEGVDYAKRFTSHHQGIKHLLRVITPGHVECNPSRVAWQIGVVIQRKRMNREKKTAST